jgi:hypothetical protein
MSGLAQFMAAGRQPAGLAFLATTWAMVQLGRTWMILAYADGLVQSGHSELAESLFRAFFGGRWRGRRP